MAKTYTYGNQWFISDQLDSYAGNKKDFLRALATQGFLDNYDTNPIHLDWFGAESFAAFDANTVSILKDKGWYRYLSNAQVQNISDDAVRTFTAATLSLTLAGGNTVASALTSNQYALVLTASLINNSTSNQTNLLTFANFKRMNADQQNALSESKIKFATDYSTLNAGGISNLTPDLLAKLSTTQINAMSRLTVFSSNGTTYLTQGQVEKLTTAQIGAMHVDGPTTGMGSWSKDSMGWMSAAQIAAIPLNAIKGLNNSYFYWGIAELSDDKFQALTLAQLGALTPNQVNGLAHPTRTAIAANKLSALSIDKKLALSVDVLNALNDNQKSSLLTFDLFKRMTLDKQNLLTAATIQYATDYDSLNPPALSTITTTTLAKLSTTQITAMSRLSVFSRENTMYLSEQQVQALTADQIRAMYANGPKTGMGSWSSTSMSWMNIDQIAAIPLEAIRGDGNSYFYWGVARLSNVQFQALTAAQIGQLTVRQVNGNGHPNGYQIDQAQLNALSIEKKLALSVDVLNALNENQKSSLLTFDLFKRMTPEKQNLLTAATIQSARDYESLNSRAISSITTTTLAKLSATQIDAMSRLSVFSNEGEMYLTELQVKALSAAQIGAMYANGPTTGMGSWSSTSMTWMNTAQIAAIPLSAIHGLGNSYFYWGISKLEIAQLKALTVAQISQLTPNQVNGRGHPENIAISPAKLYHLTVYQSAAFTADVLNALNQDQKELLLSFSVFQRMAPAQQNQLTTASVQFAADYLTLESSLIPNLSSDLLAKLSTTQIRAISSLSVFSHENTMYLSRDQVRALSAEQIGAMHVDGPTTGLGSWSKASMGWMSAAQIAAIPLNAIKGLNNSYFYWGIAELNDEQFQALTLAQLGALTPNQVNGLAHPTLVAIAETKLGALSIEKKLALSADVLNALNENQKSTLLTFDLFKRMGSEKQNLLTAATIQSARDYGSVDNGAISSLTPALLSKLSWDQIYEMSKLTVFSYNGQMKLSRDQVQALTRDQIGSMAVNGPVAGLGSWSRESMTWMTADQISGIPRDAISGYGNSYFYWGISQLDNLQFQGLAPNQIAALTPSQVNGKGHPTNTAVSAEFLAALPVAKKSAFTAAVMNAMNAEQKTAVISFDVIRKMESNEQDGLSKDTIQFASFNRRSLDGITNGKISGLTPSVIGKLSTNAIAAMSENSIFFNGSNRFISQAQIQAMTPDQIGAMHANGKLLGTGRWTANAISWMTDAQRAKIPPQALMQRLTDAEVKALTTETLQKLGPDLARSLTVAQVALLNPNAVLTDAQIINLPAEYTWFLKPSVINGLSLSVVNKLTEEQLTRVTNTGKTFASQLNAGVALQLQQQGQTLPRLNSIFNGDFQTTGNSNVWQLPSTSTISQGRLVVSKGREIAIQSGVLIPGQSYSFTFDYTSAPESSTTDNLTLGISSGAIRLNPMDWSKVIGNTARTETVSGKFIAKGTDFSIEALNSIFNGSIDNIVVERIPSEIFFPLEDPRTRLYSAVSIEGNTIKAGSVSRIVTFNDILKTNEWYRADFSYTDKNASNTNKLRITNGTGYGDLPVWSSAALVGTSTELRQSVAFKAKGSNFTLEGESGNFMGDIYDFTLTPIASVISNPSFDVTNDTNPWDFGTGVFSLANKVFATSATSIIRKSNVLTPGHEYRFSFDYDDGTFDAGSTINRLRIRTGGSNSQVNDWKSQALNGVGAGTLSGYFTATGANFSIEADTATYTGTLDNVFVEDVTNVRTKPLVDNVVSFQNFSDPSILQGWVTGSGVTRASDNLAANNSSTILMKSGLLEVGSTYTLSLKYNDAGSLPTNKLRLTDSSTASSVGVNLWTSDALTTGAGSLTAMFKATTSSLSLRSLDGNFTGTIDDLTIIKSRIPSPIIDKYNDFRSFIVRYVDANKRLWLGNTAETISPRTLIDMSNDWRTDMSIPNPGTANIMRSMRDKFEEADGLKVAFTDFFRTINFYDFRKSLAPSDRQILDEIYLILQLNAGLNQSLLGDLVNVEEFSRDVITQLAIFGAIAAPAPVVAQGQASAAITSELASKLRTIINVQTAVNAKLDQLKVSMNSAVGRTLFDYVPEDTSAVDLKYDSAFVTALAAGSNNGVFADDFTKYMKSLLQRTNDYLVGMSSNIGLLKAQEDAALKAQQQRELLGSVISILSIAGSSVACLGGAVQLGIVGFAYSAAGSVVGTGIIGTTGNVIAAMQMEVRAEATNAGEPTPKGALKIVNAMGTFNALDGVFSSYSFLTEAQKTDLKTSLDALKASFVTSVERSAMYSPGSQVDIYDYEETRDDNWINPVHTFNIGDASYSIDISSKLRELNQIDRNNTVNPRRNFSYDFDLMDFEGVNASVFNDFLSVPTIHVEWKNVGYTVDFRDLAKTRLWIDGYKF